MDFLKLKKFVRAAHKQSSVDDPPQSRKEEEYNNMPEVGKQLPSNWKQVDQMDNTAVEVDASVSAEGEDDDDDFITNEVKRRLKELRRNSFMALIPEEGAPGDDAEMDEVEDEGETSSSEWRDVEAEGRQFWSGFDAFYDTYCDRMLFFDRRMAQQLCEIGSHVPSITLEPSTSKKLSAPFRCLSLKKVKEPVDETENLRQPGTDPYQDLETAYVAQMCLTWDALHCQYTQLRQKISYGLESSTAYNHSAQQFQQFQVILQRFIENEPFERGFRPEIFARAKKSLPKLFLVPKVQGFSLPQAAFTQIVGNDNKTMEEEDPNLLILASELTTIIQSSILTFYQFEKMDKKKPGGMRNIFLTQNQMDTPLQQVQASFEKKALKLKELRKKTRRWKKNAWPTVYEDEDILLATIDVKVLLRVLRMVKMSKEQLFWCEEKMKKIDLNGDKLRRDPSPLLFPS